MMGPPGSQRQENALNLAEYFQWKCISTGDLLRKEVNKKSDYGKAIQESFKNYQYVDDKIVIDLVHKEIQEYEKNNQDWIVQGFPRTKVQALSLQKMGIIPDQLILLNIKPSTCVARIKTHLISVN
jgi:adenylate kinase